jgi:hypothetical protein
VLCKYVGDFKKIWNDEQSQTSIGKVDLNDDLNNSLTSINIKHRMGRTGSLDISIQASDIANENERDLRKLKKALVRKLPPEIKDMDKMNATGPSSFDDMLNESSIHEPSRDRKKSIELANRSIFSHLHRELPLLKASNRESATHIPIKRGLTSSLQLRHTQDAFHKNFKSQEQKLSN